MTSSSTSKEFNLADEKISSSTILSNILSNDVNELKQSIDNNMETKLNEFQNIMKMKVGSFITDKLNNFYNKPFEGYDKNLFDTDCSMMIQGFNNHARSEINKSPNLKTTLYKWYPLLENNKCFQLYYNKSPSSSDIIYVFNTYIVYIQGGISHIPEVLNHNLSMDCLFSIKYFQINNIKSGIDLYRKNPEYFNKKNYFEEICKKEYNEIEKQKNQLNILIDANLSKQEYYASLENKNKELEFQKQQLEEELVKLKDQDEKNIEIEKQKIE